MNVFQRMRAWLHLRLFSQRPVVPDPELRKLADRVEHLEDDAEKHEARLSQVEVRVGVRSTERWPKRDTG